MEYGRTTSNNTPEQDLRTVHEKIRVCRLCHLSATRTHAVPGEGPADAQVMFIGEGPGRTEDLQGRPFVGRAGKFLDECLASIGLRREQVFICNVVKCRPTINTAGSVKDRKPTQDEVDVCSPYLDQQIRLIRPRIICTLGDTATTHVFKRYNLIADSIGRIHGRPQQVGELTILPLYHPAAALYAAPLRGVILQDFRKLGDLLKKRTLDSFAGP